jgi:hypothetical protein
LSPTPSGCLGAQQQWEQTVKDNSVHDAKTRERKVSRGFRTPESLMLMLEAVQKKDGDESLNDTAIKAFAAYVRERAVAA